MGPCSDSGALNEGGGFHPRNPKDGGGGLRCLRARSMKAGAFTPATLALGNSLGKTEEAAQ